MTSDDLFWRLVLAMRTVDEAALVWRLAAVRADEHPYRISNRGISRHLGEAVTRQTLDRMARRLAEAGTVSTRVLRNAYTEYRLEGGALARLLDQLPSAQSEPPHACVTVARIEPLTGDLLGLPKSTAGTRLCLLRRSREDSLLLVWLLQLGAHLSPICVSGRGLQEALLGLIDRMTAMRSLARLASAGLVSVTPMGRSGTEYSLNGDALHTLMHQLFPFHEDAAATMPGWANVDFPLLHRLAQGRSAGTTPAAEDAAMEV
jgi:hypothetical protein